MQNPVATIALQPDDKLTAELTGSETIKVLNKQSMDKTL